MPIVQAVDNTRKPQQPETPLPQRQEELDTQMTMESQLGQPLPHEEKELGTRQKESQLAQPSEMELDTQMTMESQLEQPFYYCAFLKKTHKKSL
jgi:hypothetical protein